MHQIAFTLGPLQIHWYGICIATGFVLATLLMIWKRAYARMTQDQIFDLAMLALFSGIVGARLFFVIQFWDVNFAGRPFLEVFRIDKGGIVFYGGFILAFVSVCIYAYRKKISIRRMLDLLSPAIALAHACGRVGCFLQGCCHGKPAPEGFPGSVVYPPHSFPFDKFPAADHACSLPLYPVQLYESALNLVLCGVLVWMLGRNRKPGRIAAAYLIGYALIRFTLEFFRGDHTDHFLGLTPSQNIALFLMLPLGVIVYFLFPEEKQSSPEKKNAEKK